jgi:hypothetical protein
MARHWTRCPVTVTPPIDTLDSCKAAMLRKVGRDGEKGCPKAQFCELINTGRDKRYVKRTASGRFKESDDVGKSLSRDRRWKAKRT